MYCYVSDANNDAQNATRALAVAHITDGVQTVLTDDAHEHSPHPLPHVLWRNTQEVYIPMCSLPASK